MHSDHSASSCPCSIHQPHDPGRRLLHREEDVDTDWRVGDATQALAAAATITTTTQSKREREWKKRRRGNTKNDGEKCRSRNGATAAKCATRNGREREEGGKKGSERGKAAKQKGIVRMRAGSVV